MKYQPHAYQERAKSFILDHPAAGLFLSMGLGKTVVTLTAIDELMYDSFEVSKVLVIAPLRVAEDTWSREAAKWDHLRHLRISKILGSAGERIAGLEADADVYIINRENVVWLVTYLKDHKKPWPFDMIVIDELSSFKSNQAKRFKALRYVRPMIDRVVGLTGTPAANGLMDLWAEIYLLDRGQRLGPTITGYRARWFKPAWGQGNVVYKWAPTKDAMREITHAIDDITVSMKAEDYLQLPDRIDTTITVHLDDKALKAYRSMEQKALIELEGEEVTAFSAPAIMNKLLQMANGFIYTETHEPKAIHAAKLEALEELIEAADGPVLVYYEFQADKDLILKSVKGARLLESDKDIADWNDGKIPVLLAHPASAGYGLNLQDGGHIMVWYGLPWSLELYQQAVARLQRQGQRYPVLNYSIIAEGTVDDQVAAALARKDMSQSALLAALKERRERCDTRRSNSKD